MTAYTEREKEIIKHYQAIYEQFGKGADTYSVFGFNSPSLGFIYPQVLDTLIEKGCTGFIAHVWNGNGLYGHTTYSMHKSIMDIELEDEKENTMSETKQEMNAVEFLNNEAKKLGIEYFRTYESGLSGEIGVIELATNERDLLESPLNLRLYPRGTHVINSYSFNSNDWQETNRYAQLIQKAAGIACKWEALHATDESLDSEDDSEDEDDFETFEQSRIERKNRANELRNTIQVDSELREDVKCEYRGSHKIGAIKYYRQQTGANLLEAKVAVEMIMSGHFDDSELENDSVYNEQWQNYNSDLGV